MPTISVIVPVYKVEQYLDRCVKSILVQTFTDFELILVDDGSPDHCGAMCDAWAEKDSRIKVIHKENGGLSDARNVGFEASKGEWITFVDSDDYVHPRMMEALYGAVMTHGVQLSVCGYAYTEGEALPSVQQTAACLWDAEVFYRERYSNATVAWGKLYHRSVVLPYPKGKLHEDNFVTYRILFGCERIAAVDGALYGYYHNTAGITQSPWTPRRMDDFEAFEQQLAYFSENGRKSILLGQVRRYMECILWQLELLGKLPQPECYCTEKKQMEQRARSLLLRYLPQKAFWGDKDMWIYARFFPRSTKGFCTVQALWRKVTGLFRKA